jgi:hypothetical protein
MKCAAGVVTLIVALGSCMPQRDIQIRSVDVKLLRIDTIQRGNLNEKMLTWETEDKLKMYSIEDFDANYAVGTSMKVFVTR